MKIEKIEIMSLRCDNVEDRSGWRPIVCRIYTDSGIYGDGEAAVAYGKGAPAAYGMLEEYAPVLIGMDPLDNEVIWDKLYRDYFWGLNGGPITFAAISALDMALWDIKGKYFNVPIYKLLGGKKRDKVRCYASMIQQGWGDEYRINCTPEMLAESALAAVKDGYDCIKADFFTHDVDGRRFNHPEENTQLRKPYYVNLVEEKVAAVRKAVGPDVDIIVENHAFTDTNMAIQIGQAVEKYNIFYFEEANTPFLNTVEKVRDKVNIPIAHGERIYSRWQYAPYLVNNAIDVIQPDIGTCGGITEVKKICDMAYIYDVGVQIHACGSPLSTAAAMQLEAVIPNFVIHEQHAFANRKFNIDLCKYNYQPKNGYLEIPDRPGLGNELSEEAIKNCLKKTVIQ